MTPQATQARLEHLFRASGQAGSLSPTHPLKPLLAAYRGLPDAVAPAAQTVYAVPAAQTGAALLTSPDCRIAPDLLRQRVSELPALPEAALRALRALRDESASINECAELIGNDQALVARVLRLANSAFYGVPGRVASIRDAVSLLGRRTLASLVSVAAVAGQFTAHSCPAFDFAAFWRHAMGAALAAQGLAAARHSDESQAFTVGLLHDIGHLALAAHFPLQMDTALRRCRDSVELGSLEEHHAGHAGSLAVEREVLGTDHAEVGALVAAHWSFPADVVQAIGAHHTSELDMSDLVALAHLGDAISHALDFNADPAEQVPAIHPAAWQRLAPARADMLRLLAHSEAGVVALGTALSL